MLCMVMTGCADTSPVNLQPELMLGEASDITRTEATVTLKIVSAEGSSPLSYVQISCASTDGVTATSPNLFDGSAEVTYTFTALKPNQTYTVTAKGGTATATIFSREVTFKTEPNTLPTVAEVTTLSTGPTGVVVAFDITDTGGEPVTRAGCRVYAASEPNDQRIITLAPSDLTTGSHRLYITGLRSLTQYKIAAFAENSMGTAYSPDIDFATKDGVNIVTAGDLPGLFDNSPVTAASLAIAGPLNGTDFAFLRRCAIGVLDLSDADIVAGGESYDGSRYTETNVFGKGLMAGCKALKTLTLPNSALEIQSDAVANCPALHTLVLGTQVSKTAVSAGCENLAEIIVSKANTHFASVDGVLFDSAVTQILWFPLGKTGDYTLPATVTSIGEKAFLDTHITRLTIPESVTEIRRGAFCGSALEEIVLPDKMTNVSEGLFQNCESLKSVTLGLMTEFIGNYAFDGSPLTSLTVRAQIPPYTAENAFFNRLTPMSQNCTLRVPKGTKAVYRNHAGWKIFTKIEEL